VGYADAFDLNAAASAGAQMEQAAALAQLCTEPRERDVCARGLFREGGACSIGWS
jgi:hypothetical protein